ncbi:MAG: FAD-binding oxidoreductase [Candidatus Rokuibacteriota bacterium]
MPSLVERLTGIAGSGYVLSGVECSPYVLEGRTPEAVVFPGSRDEVSAILALASEVGTPVVPWGGGTRMSVGAPPQRAGIVLGVRRLDRIVEHEPGDLTATAEAGITLATLQSSLGARGQWLSLDPPQADRASLGGILASNASGPRRHLYGTARDLLIGLTLVLADGTVVRGGGKVVKNVAGYDLPKLAVGSFGTLGLIVEATVKLRPKPDVDHLVVLPFAALADAGQIVRAVMASDLIPSAVELVDAEAVRAAGLPATGCAVLLGVDGLPEQVQWQEKEMERLAGVRATVLDGAARDEAWTALGDLPRRAFTSPTAAMTWAVLPTQVAGVMADGREAAARRKLGAAFASHAGVGLVSAVLGDAADAGEVASVLVEWRRLVEERGGHAVLEWAPLAIKERVQVWEASGPAHRIMKRLKEELDPRGILNPGRFVGGI